MLELSFFLALLCITVSLVLFFKLRRLQAKLSQTIKEHKTLSEQVRLDQRRSHSDQRELNAILSSLVEGVLVLGAEEKIEYISANLSKMFDFRSSVVVGKPYWEVIPHASVIAALKEALTTHQPLSREIQLLAEPQKIFDVQISPVIHEGKNISLVAIFHDISDLKKLLNMRTEFVANVSHEFKTPLTSIKGYVENLLEPEGLDTEDARKFLLVIQRQTMRLEDLVKDLLTIAAIENKDYVLDLQLCDIEQLFQSAVLCCKAQIQAKGQEIKVSCPKDLPKVMVDARRMEQVLVNLLDNAVKFTPPKGTIELKADVQLPYICLHVKDSGIGISPEHLPRIFERFYRVDKSRTQEAGGTGLGLAIVKHIVLAHNGKVDVQSVPGQETTFRVFIPAIQ